MMNDIRTRRSHKPMKELILGGARSGKSAYAERRARASGLRVVYIATAEAGDGEMTARIALHRARRPAEWSTVEAPLALAETLRREAKADRCLLVDCLTLWLSNLLAGPEGADERFEQEKTLLLEILPQLPGQIHLVSNEVGQGIVPMNTLARRFVDEAGLLHQALAQCCERVVLVTAGLPHILKDTP